MRNIQPLDSELRELGELAQKAVNLPVSSEIHSLGRKRIVAQARLLSGTIPQARRVRTWAVGALATTAATFLVVWFAARLRPLTYESDGGSRFESGYVSVPPDRSTHLTFSDGSAIDAQPGTRLRVEAARHDGARVVVERGQVQAYVQHYRSTSWQFITGPFEVHVVGTALTLGWDPSKEEVNLTLQEGAVEVKSPLGRGPFIVRKGQHFRASLLNHSVLLQDTVSDAVAPAAAADTGHAQADAPTPVTTGLAPDNAESPQEPQREPTASVTNVVKSTPVPSETWSAWVSHGRFQDVVTAAEAKGFDTCLRSCNLSDVRALADAARYTNRADLAVQSLLTIRQRANTGAQHSAAAFLLGRIAESRGQIASANTWYETYLSEAPSGEFAADSLAGAMRATARLKGNAAARPLAMQYLQRYPNGVHATTASKLANGQ